MLEEGPEKTAEAMSYHNTITHTPPSLLSLSPEILYIYTFEDV
jgi:hypothetical protein